MGYFLLTVALILNGAANLLMKLGADHIGPMSAASSVIKGVLTNYYLIGGLVLFALNVIFYVAALTRLNLSIAYPVMLAGGVLIVVSVSILYFGEQIDLSQILGIVLVVAGLGLLTHQTS